MKKKMIRGAVVCLLASLQQALAFTIVPTPESGTGIQVVKCERDHATIIASESGSLTIDEPGEIDILLVGGGGGGGVSNTYGGGAGGGAGGFVYRQSFAVNPGTYPVVVGKGGGVGVNGGDSTAFGLIAHGGGRGANNRNSTVAGDGGSGGGASAAFGADGTIGLAGQALGTDDNLGYDGAGVPTDGGNRYRRPGGGGGAGEDGHVSVRYGGGGGNGKVCSITGRAVWYAGGGAGTYGDQEHGGWVVDDTTGDGKGGKGGGGNAGCPGADGLGGGGGGDAEGGDGVVIVRYRRSVPDVNAKDFDIVSSDATTSWVLDGEVAIVFEQNGQFTVAGGGYADMMMVGGGGGGGESNTQGGGAGGGAGGFLYRQGVYLAPGSYSVEVGGGGEVGANGGDTRVAGFVAYGGGCGAKNRKYAAAGNGGSGGGQTEDFDHNKSNIGKAAYLEEFNIGHDGGESVNYMQTGGGGGAGSEGWSVSGYGGPGGTGIVCRITGADVWYAGGGAGTYGAENANGWKTNPVTRGGLGGMGGGGNAGCPGVDGLGGGGGGDAKGGSGVCVIRFAKKLYPEVYDDAMGGTVNRRGGYRIHTFSESGTFTMPAHGGKVDVLLVGGGGGGGESYTEGGGAGGGAGGFVYKESIFVRAGEYTVTVGEGGSVGNNGGDSTVFGIVAYGGGCGAKNRMYIAAGNGGSGGGATADFSGNIGPVGKALYANADNSGHDGGLAKDYRRSGGGGGAGEAGHMSVKNGGGAGGDGLSCSITGRDVWYAGGGAGAVGAQNSSGWVVDDSTGDGKGGKGGGGNAGCPGVDGLGGGGGGDARGGDGIVIIRYKTQPIGFHIILR